MPRAAELSRRDLIERAVAAIRTGVSVTEFAVLNPTHAIHSQKVDRRVSDSVLASPFGRKGNRDAPIGESSSLSVDLAASSRRGLPTRSSQRRTRAAHEAARADRLATDRRNGP